IQVDSTAWQASIRRLVPLMGRDDSRATYLGLRFASDHRGHRMLATEGKVFARVGVDFDIGTTTIVPPRAVEHIVKYIGKDASVAVDGARFHVKSGGVSYSTTTIAGPYPDIEAIFDARSGHSVMFSKEKAQEALRSVLCCNPFQERIRMVPTGGGFYLRAKSIDGEPAEEFVDAEGSLPSFSVSKFCLQKALNFSGENVTIWMEECERRTGGGAQSALVTSELPGELVFAPVALDHEDLK
ncbi:MAG: hypothetical protein LUO93_10290, partial [Methanomicrobiales archaeon]|nr:hypothetical protein [Methanomicrobiales archaeon]